MMAGFLRDPQQTGNEWPKLETRALHVLPRTY